MKKNNIRIHQSIELSLKCCQKFNVEIRIEIGIDLNTRIIESKKKYTKIKSNQLWMSSSIIIINCQNRKHKIVQIRH